MAKRNSYSGTNVSNWAVKHFQNCSLIFSWTFGHIRIFSPGTSKLRIRQNYFYNIFSGIGYMATNLLMTPNNPSIHGCQQASDFSSAPLLLFLRKIYDYIIFFRSISGIFTCEFSICPTYRIFAQLCTKCSRQIAIQHRNHRLFVRETSAVPVSFLPDRKSPENRSLHFPGL